MLNVRFRVSFLLFFAIFLNVREGICVETDSVKLPTLYPFTSNGKWGYIDATGAWVIAPQFDRCMELFTGEWVRAKEGKLWGCIDRTGKWIVKPTFDNWFAGESAPLGTITLSEKHGLLNRSGQIILPMKYDEIVVFNDRAWVRDGEKLGVFSLDGHWILKPSIDWPKGREMPIPTDGGAVSWFKRKQKWGLISGEGKELFKPQFEEHVMGRRESEEWAHPEGLDFKNHRAWVSDGKNYILISNEGRMLARQPFSRVREWTDQLYVFTLQNELKGLVSRDGDIVIPAQYVEIRPVVEDRAVVTQRNDKKKANGETEINYDYGYLDAQGRVVVEVRSYLGPGGYGGGQAELAHFSEGLAPVWNNGAENAKKQTYDPYAGYINRSGALVIPEQFYRTEPFSEGLGAVLERVEKGKGYSPEGGLWGYVDKTGELAIKPQFGWATPFCKGRAWVLQAGAKWDEPKWAMIDRQGKVLTDYAYEPPERRNGWRFNEGERLSKSRWRGNLAVLSRYDFHNGLATADGKVLVEPLYNTIREFQDGIAVATDSRDRDERGNVKFTTLLITERGEVLANGTYTDISDFDKGVAWASRRSTDHRGPYVNEGWGLIDTKARELTEMKYVKASWVWSPSDTYSDNQYPHFYGELAPVVATAGYETTGLYNRMITNGWGYLNRSGKIIVWEEKTPKW